MQNTTNYNLKKPETTDNYNVQDQNDNMDTIDLQMKQNADSAQSAATAASQVQTNLTAHQSDIATEQGRHGIRYWLEKLEILVDGVWVEVQGGGGGIPVSQPSNFQGSPGDGIVNLSWQNPPNVIVKDIDNNNLILAEFDNVEVKRDGALIYEGVLETFLDTGLTNYQEYTYEIVSISTMNVRSQHVIVVVAPVPFTMDYAIGVTNFVAVGATELGGQADLTWTNPTHVNFAGVLVRRGVASHPTTIDDGVLVYEGIAESFIDLGLTNGQTYYYTIWAYSIYDEYSNVDNVKMTTTEVMQGQDGSGSPGSAVLLQGDTVEGYFGRVPSADFISGTALASAIGLSAGTSQHPTVDWLKFMIDGKVIFSPMKAIRSNLSWDHIQAANAVNGSKTVVINGLTYKVRLWKGAQNNPSNYTDADRDAIGSEWNRLMLPIHVNAPSSWVYPAYVASPTKDWGTNFTDADLLTHHTHGDGSYSWCQETRGDNAARRVLRGYDGVSYSYSNSSSVVHVNYGFRPVLELL